MRRIALDSGRASIFDLRKDASLDAIATEVRSMHLSALSAFLTRWIFRVSLLRRAYTREAVEALVAKSRFAMCQFEADGIGFEVQLTREGKPG